jgi:hypothetical protein
MIRKLQAILCARGNKQLYGVDFFETFAPVCNYDWEIHKGLLEVFDKYGFRYIFDISVLITLKWYISRFWMIMCPFDTVHAKLFATRTQ